MYLTKIDALLQYILACASELDEYTERELGPIHLIKYVYLADLAYAEAHNGQTFTGLNWQFFRFGPWSLELNNRIPQALEAIGATCTRYPSAFTEDDYVRWCIHDSNIRDAAGRQIGLPLCGFLDRVIGRFANSTPELLDFVYKTPPMLNAAPQEYLNFSPSGWKYHDTRQTKRHFEKITLTRRQEKKLSTWAANVQYGVQERLAKLRRAKQQTSARQSQPIIDEVFFQGIAALNCTEGYEIQEGKLTAEFDSNIWKSRVRHDPELPD